MKRKIAILWHMHQPYYRNPHTKKIELPWVRLHGLKDYYGMVNILKDFPKIKATYNLVPSLLVQLESYLQGEKDIFQELFIKDAGTLTVEEVRFIVRHFFSANYINLIKPYPRFRYLFDKKKRHKSSVSNPADWFTVFTTAELRDLQVWNQLCHFDEYYKEHDERIRNLIKKGEEFSETDKCAIQEAELELLGKIIPEYKKFADSGQIEISTTPFYHPILPLLLDPQKGREANPHLPEYDLHFHWKEDALHQLEQALEYMHKTFGRTPTGIWPSEGSLSQEVMEILNELGIQWTATDEANLSKSVGIPIHRHHYIVQNSDLLYKPYILDNMPETTATRIFFRDCHLSDLIGFHYRKMSYKRAAADLVDRLKRIPAPHSQEMVIPIILDGENAWEYFPNSGRAFLSEFFRLVSEDDALETVTFSEASHIKPGKLHHLSAGSWISGNFDIWIGDEEDRRGWKLMEKTRSVMERHATGISMERTKEVHEYLSIAQGSDWFWWFGKENYTPDLDIFDNLFRQNLQKIYEVLGEEVPVELYTPVSLASAAKGGGIVVMPPSHPIKPHINGKVNSYFEYLHAGRMEAPALGGAMNIANPLANTLWYGFDQSHFFLRVDTEKEAAFYFKNDYSLDVIIKKQRKQHVLPILAKAIEGDCPATVSTQYCAAVGSIIELSLPLKSLKLKPGDNFRVQLEWKRNGNHFQSIPAYDFFRATVPTAKDYNRFWHI